MTIIDLHTGKYVNEIASSLVIALGTFDGVHIGHRRLLECAVSRAEAAEGVKSAVWTFSEIPKNAVAAPGVAPMPVPYIMTLEERLEIFTELGIDYAVVEDFASVRNVSPEEFVSDILCDTLCCACAVCGFNFKFGSGGAGDSVLLQKLMDERGLGCEVIPPVILNGKIVSSSYIRSLIEDGDMEEAEHAMGRPFSIKFPVVYGNQLGRTIGIPTINQNFPAGHVLPRRGIYCCTCEVGENNTYLGVANVGVRPTVDQSGAEQINCETHIINYNGWLYGQNIKVSFYRRLRDEKRFGSMEKLQEAIFGDITSTMEYFSHK